MGRMILGAGAGLDYRVSTVSDTAVLSSAFNVAPR